jgi:hypothetical protein
MASLTASFHLRVFHMARAEAFTGPEAASLLARRPYDLRSVAVSTWLNAGVPAAQVAAWAGHSPDVLMRVYASASRASKTKPSAGFSQRPGCQAPASEPAMRENFGTYLAQRAAYGSSGPRTATPDMINPRPRMRRPGAVFEVVAGVGFEPT